MKSTRILRPHAADRQGQARDHWSAPRFVPTLPVGSVMYEPQSNAKGERMIWLEEKWLNQLGAMCGPGESYSDVILRLMAG
jgi:hypothetical protein